MEDDRVILLDNFGEPVNEEDDLNLTDPTGNFWKLSFLRLVFFYGTVSYNFKRVGKMHFAPIFNVDI